jgi:hypothetical protein
LKRTKFSLWFLLTSGTLALSASPPVIGMALSPGAFSINNASVPGSATVLDGSTIQTAAAFSDIRLTNSVRLTLGDRASATLYRQRAVLHSGTVELRSAPGYRIEAQALRIGASGPGARIDVGVQDGERVTVASLSGKAEVRTGKGTLIARLMPGEAREFDPAPPSLVRLSGILTRLGAVYVLDDEVTHVRVQLRGNALGDMLEKRVRVTGIAGSGTPQAGASQLVDVTEIQPVETATVGGPGGSAPKPAAVAFGLSVRTIAIAGGIAGAGAIGGLAAAGAFSGSVSR